MQNTPHIDPNLIIGALSLLCAFIFSFLSARHTGAKDVESRIAEARKEAAEETKISTLLQSIKSDTEEMRHEMREIKAETKTLTERVVKVEQSAKSLHHRVDRMEETLEAKKGE